MSVVSLFSLSILLCMLYTSFSVGQTAALLSGTAKGEQTYCVDFMRLATAEDGTPAALELAITRLSSDDGMTVDLLAVLHVADTAFFRRIDSAAAVCDVVLFEMVATGSVPDTVRTNEDLFDDTPMRRFYKHLAALLGMMRQQEGIDYTRPTFVHADLSEQEMNILLPGFKDSLPDYSNDERMYTLLENFPSGLQQEMRLSLRRVFADGLLKREDSADLMDRGVPLRNQRVLDVLREQRRIGKMHIGILYGVGHFPDLQERLSREFGMKVTDRFWHEAWSVR
jgi:hypothetical protein